MGLAVGHPARWRDGHHHADCPCDDRRARCARLGARPNPVGAVEWAGSSRPRAGGTAQRTCPRGSRAASQSRAACGHGPRLRGRHRARPVLGSRRSGRHSACWLRVPPRPYRSNMRSNRSRRSDRDLLEDAHALGMLRAVASGLVVRGGGGDPERGRGLPPRRGASTAQHGRARARGPDPHAHLRSPAGCPTGPPVAGGVAPERT